MHIHLNRIRECIQLQIEFMFIYSVFDFSSPLLLPFRFVFSHLFSFSTPFPIWSIAVSFEASNGSETTKTGEQNVSRCNWMKINDKRNETSEKTLIRKIHRWSEGTARQQYKHDSALNCCFWYVFAATIFAFSSFLFGNPIVPPLQSRETSMLAFFLSLRPIAEHMSK